MITIINACHLIMNRYFQDYDRTHLTIQQKFGKISSPNVHNLVW